MTCTQDDLNLKLMLNWSLFNMEEIDGKNYKCLTIPDFDFYENKDRYLDIFRNLNECEIIRVKTLDNNNKIFFEMFSLNNTYIQLKLIEIYGGENGRCFYSFD